jgi:hypothetical protein
MWFAPLVMRSGADCAINRTTIGSSPMRAIVAPDDSDRVRRFSGCERILERYPTRYPTKEKVRRLGERTALVPSWGNPVQNACDTAC